jgi:hypothetical protein
LSGLISHRMLIATLATVLMSCTSTSVQYSGQGTIQYNGEQNKGETTNSSGQRGLEQPLTSGLAAERDSPLQVVPLSAESTAVKPTPPTSASNLMATPPEILPPELIVLEQSAKLHIKLPDDLTRDWLARQGINLSPGSCRLTGAFNSSKTTTHTKTSGSPNGYKNEVKNKSEFRLISELPSSETEGPAESTQRKGELGLFSSFVLISDSKSKTIIGVARADNEGRFTCQDLPQNLSIQFSTEDVLGNKVTTKDSNSVSLTQKELGSVKLRIESSSPAPKDGAPATIAAKGLLLRIARRKQEIDGMSNPSNDAPLKWSWLRSNRDSSLGLRIDSYFQQTFLFRSDLFEIALPAGPYLFVITNPATNLSCYVSSEIAPGKSLELSCPEKKLVFEDYNRKSTAPEDTTILLVPTGATEDVLGSRLGFIAGSELQLAELSQSESSAVIHANLSRSNTQQRKMKKSKNSKTLEIESQNEQIVLDGSFSDLKDISIVSTDRIEKYLAATLIPDLVLNSQTPAAAAKEEAKYFNPLYTQTRLMLSTNRGLAADSIHTVATNGVIFRWRSIDPRSSLVPMPSDGVLNFEVVIPAYNLTEFIEIHVNGSLKRRIVLGRKNIAEPSVINVEERFNTKSDADVSIFAWGRPFLPEFLYGQSKISPRAVSSRICLDVNKNYICDLIPERPRP